MLWTTRTLLMNRSRLSSNRDSFNSAPVKQAQEDRLFTCPICSIDFPESKIEKHAERCTGSKEAKSNLLPLPKPVYHLLKDSQIRAKLKELGLKTNGSREVFFHYILQFINYV